MNRLKSLGVVGLAALCGFGLAEATVRVREFLKYGSGGRDLFARTVDPKSGLTIPVANQDTGRVRINSLGFRGPEITGTKPASTVRLAFLGSSTTFCTENSSNEATWPHLVWKALSERYQGKVQFDYLNAGFPGYRLQEDSLNLKYRVAPLKPDVIVIYEATNDLTLDTRPLAVQQGLLHGKPEDPGFLARHSLLYYLIEKNLQMKARQQQAVSGAARLVYDPDALAKGFHDRLKQLVEDSQAVAPVVAVATFSHKFRRDQSRQEQLRACVTSLYYMPYMSVDGLLVGFDAYNRAIRDVARETGAILIDGEDAIPGDDEHFNDSVHFKDPGSVLMARRVTVALTSASAFADLVAPLEQKADTRALQQTASK